METGPELREEEGEEEDNFSEDELAQAQADFQAMFEAEHQKLAKVSTYGFRVYDEETLNWIAKKIAIEEHAVELETRAYRERIAGHRRSIKALLRLFGASMDQVTRQLLDAQRPRKKSYMLACGVMVGYQKTKTTLEEHFKGVPKEDRFAWARQNCPEALDQEEVMRKQALSAHYERTGEVPPGYKVNPGSENTFFHRVPKLAPAKQDAISVAQDEEIAF